MDTSKREEIIQQLKLEKSILEDGGYGRSVRKPWQPSTYFRDSITCLNHGEEQKVHPCSECFLSQYVHPAYRAVELPCHFIHLSPDGDTIDSLLRSGDIDKLEKLLCAWLDSKVRNLEAADDGESSGQG